jgi:hypothetical protein
VVRESSAFDILLPTYRAAVPSPAVTSPAMACLPLDARTVAASARRSNACGCGACARTSTKAPVTAELEEAAAPPLAPALEASAGALKPGSSTCGDGDDSASGARDPVPRSTCAMRCSTPGGRAAMSSRRATRSLFCTNDGPSAAGAVLGDCEGGKRQSVGESSVREVCGRVDVNVPTRLSTPTRAPWRLHTAYADGWRCRWQCDSPVLARASECVSDACTAITLCTSSASCFRRAFEESSAKPMRTSPLYDKPHSVECSCASEKRLYRFRAHSVSQRPLCAGAHSQARTHAPVATTTQPRVQPSG